MQSKYPSPCLKCDKDYCKKCGDHYKECAEWLTWFRWWWNRFRVTFTAAPKKVQENDKFCYSHPDQVKRYLKLGPCAVCSAEQNCDTPCKAYLRWYNGRMEIARKKAGL